MMAARLLFSTADQPSLNTLLQYYVDNEDDDDKPFIARHEMNAIGYGLPGKGT